MLFLVKSLPRELKEETIKYCSMFEFVLDSTGLFPVSTKTSTKSRGRIVYWAAENGYFYLLKWAKQNKCPYGYDETIGYLAAKGGHLEILKWTQETKKNISDKWFCAQAAKGGHLEILKYLRENGYEWDAWTCAWATGGGHFDVVKWAQEHGCPDTWSCYFENVKTRK